MNVFDLLRDPQLPDDDDARSAAVVMALIRAVLLGLFVLVGASILEPVNQMAISMAMYGPVAVVFLASAALLHRDHVRPIAWGVTLVLWGVVALSLFAFGGLRTNTGASLILCVIVAITALGPRPGLGFAVASTAVAALAGWAEVAGTLPEPLAPMTPFNSFLGLTIPLLISTVVVVQSKSRLDLLLERERARSAALLDAERAAERRARQAQVLARLGQIAAAARSLDELLAQAGPLLAEVVGSGATHALLLEADQLVARWPPELASRTPAPIRPELSIEATTVLGPEVDPSPLERAAPGRCWVVAPIPGLEGNQGLVAIQLDAAAVDSHLDFVTTVAGLFGASGDRERVFRRATEAQKLEAVGRMAGGVAHDFNNLLTVILGGAAMLRLDEGAHPIVDSIEGAGQRAALLTRQLLVFSQGRIAEPEPVDVPAIVSGAAPLLERLIGESVELHIETQERSVMALASRVAIEQILLNLVLNGSQAIGESDGQVSVTAALDGNDVLLVVEDTGPGVPDSARSSIFDPFFTTRSTGSGLGLATVKDIVVQLGGDLRLVSEAGRGARFEVRLPRVEAVPTFTDAADDDLGSRPILLVVDDEPLVARHVSELMRRDGWTVHTAGNGREATELLAGGLNPTLVLSDVVMPELDGIELVQWIRAHGSDVPIVLMSGWHDAQEAVDGLTGPVVSLPKPFDRTRLREALQKALRRR